MKAVATDKGVNSLTRLPTTKLGTTLFSGHIVIIALLIITLVYTVWLRSEILEMTVQSSPALTSSLMMQHGVEVATAALRGYVTFGQASFQQDHREAWKEVIWPAFSNLQNLHRVDENQLKGLLILLKNLESSQWWVMDLSSALGNTPAIEEYEKNLRPVIDTIGTAIDSLIRLQDSHAVVDGQTNKSLLDLDEAHLQSRAAMEEFIRSHDLMHENRFRRYAKLAREHLSRIVLVDERLSRQQREVLSLLKLEFTAYQLFSDQLITTHRSDHWNRALLQMQEVTNPLGNSTHTTLEVISSYLRQQLDMASRALRSSSDRTLMVTVSLLVALGCVLIWLSFFISRHITRPLAQLSHGVKALAENHLAAEIPVQYRDEIGLLAESFNSMRRSLDESSREIRVSEQRYRAIFQQAGDGIVLFDPQTMEKLAFNDKACEQLGYTREEFESVGIADIEVVESKHESIEHAVQITAQGETFETRHRMKNGEIRDVLVNASLVSLEGKQVIQGIWRDISRRKQVENALRESEDRFRTLFENAGESLFLMTSAGRFVNVNQLACSALGYTWDELISLPVTSIDPSLGGDRFIESTQLMQSKPVITLESVHRRKDGSTFPVEIRAGSVEIGGKAHVLLMARDISERKKTEEQTQKYRDSLEELVEQRTAHLESEIEERKRTERELEELLSLNNATLEATTDGILVVNLEGNVSGSNRTFQEMWNIPDALMQARAGREIMDHLWDQLVDPPVDAGELFVNPVEDRFEILLTKDGRTFEQHSKLQTLRNSVVGRVITYREITSRLQAEQQTTELQEQLLQTQKMEAIGTLAGGIAHDFNNILAGLQGYVELAKRQVSDGSQVLDSLQELEGGIDRATDLVKQILTFSRHEEAIKAPLKVNALVRDALKLLRPALPSTIEMRTEVQPSDSVIMADPTQMHQVLVNLCTNASTAMEDGGGVLQLIVNDVQVGENAWGLLPGAYVEISVADSGVGIEPYIIDRIFDPFFTTKDVGKGTGLGLSIVHSIVQNHNGSIRVDSKPGEGTIFTILLPCSESSKPVDTMATEAPYGGSESILFVDDEKAITRAIKQLLEALGYGVVATNSSIEALEIFAARPNDFDLVITDQTMPGMTGGQLIVKLLAIRPDLPIILCTGNSDRFDEKQARVAGVRRYLNKPIRLRTFGEAIRSIFDDV